MPILVRGDNPSGYVVYPGKELPPEYVPWGTLAATTVVFAPDGTPPPRLGALKPYTATDSRLRRGLCEEGLASLVIQRRDFVESALTRVNDGLIGFMNDRKAANKDAEAFMAKRFQEALFTDKYWDGRLGPESAAPRTSEAMLEATVKAMRTAPVPIVMNIHATFVFCKFVENIGATSEDQGQLYKRWREKIGPNMALFKQRARFKTRLPGPETKDGKVPEHAASTRAGYLGDEAPKGGWDVPARVRGVDEWTEDVENPSDFTQDLHARNFNYVSGASGTTGGLLLGAIVLANLTTQEELKQYVLAAAGFLIGGGHHCYHEVMVTAAVTGCPYVTGEYLPSLPKSFLCSRECEMWKGQYYDIVTNR